MTVVTSSKARENRERSLSAAQKCSLLCRDRDVNLIFINVSILVFCVVTPSELVGRYQRLGGTYRLRLQGCLYLFIVSA